MPGLDNASLEKRLRHEKNIEKINRKKQEKHTEYELFGIIYQKYKDNKKITKKETKSLENNLCFLILKYLNRFFLARKYQSMINNKKIKNSMVERELKRLTIYLKFLISEELIELTSKKKHGRTFYIITSKGRNFVKNFLSNKHL